MSTIRPWKVLSTRKLNNYKIFETRTDRVVSPRTGAEHDVYIVTGSSWVNILAYTEQKEIILVQQYRHGVRKVMWEIPGGVMDKDETPENAAARELLEETGYAGDQIRVIGQVHPNPAFQTNICYTVLIEGAKCRQPPQMEEMEDIAIRLISENDFESMIADGTISNSLVVVADLWRRLWKAGHLATIKS